MTMAEHSDDPAYSERLGLGQRKRHALLTLSVSLHNLESLVHLGAACDATSCRTTAHTKDTREVPETDKLVLCSTPKLRRDRLLGVELAERSGIRKASPRLLSLVIEVWLPNTSRGSGQRSGTFDLYGTSQQRLQDDR